MRELPVGCYRYQLNFSDYLIVNGLNTPQRRGKISFKNAKKYIFFQEIHIRKKI